MKIKTFRYEISDWKGLHTNPKNLDTELVVPSIDNEVNEFLALVKPISVDIKSHTLHRHNNGSNDTIILIYTILYEGNN